MSVLCTEVASAVTAAAAESWFHSVDKGCLGGGWVVNQNLL